MMSPPPDRVGSAPHRSHTSPPSRGDTCQTDSEHSKQIISCKAGAVDYRLSNLSVADFRLVRDRPAKPYPLLIRRLGHKDQTKCSQFGKKLNKSANFDPLASPSRKQRYRPSMPKGRNSSAVTRSRATSSAAGASCHPSHWLTDGNRDLHLIEPANTLGVSNATVSRTSNCTMRN